MKYAAQEIKTGLYDTANVFAMAKGLLVSYIVTIPVFVVFALILAYTDFPEKHMTAAVAITTVVSIVVAGSSSARNLKSRGWLNGGIVGAVYILVLYLLSSLTFGDFGIDSHVVTMFFVGVLSGAIGGIIGINLNGGAKKTRHKR